MSLHNGQRWEFYNATTGETREYEVSKPPADEDQLVYLDRVDGGGNGVARVYAATMFADHGEGVSRWRLVA